MQLTPQITRCDSKFFRLFVAREHRELVVLQRLSCPYETSEEVSGEVERLVQAFNPADRQRKLLVDMRLAPPRNDDAFEAAMAKLRLAVGDAFAQVAVLVRSASGEMQATRLHRSERRSYTVARDVSEAFEQLGLGGIG